MVTIQYRVHDLPNLPCSEHNQLFNVGCPILVTKSNYTKYFITKSVFIQILYHIISRAEFHSNFRKMSAHEIFCDFILFERAPK